ncbi:MAG TPA: DUF1223 domain-containing protein [Candidatus Cybelea sp.]|nr:DUF1223 domain-containing protein [Candidatus Cybelea sp.]
MKTANLAVVFGALSATMVGASGYAADKPPTVVELFTSEGCNSCPPADAFLGDLVKRTDVLALSYHVDYWDYLGWKDTWASKELTDRQRAYGRSLGSRYVYTPQMVIGGTIDVVGSDRGAVEGGIERAPRGDVSMNVARGADGRLWIDLPAAAKHAEAALWLVKFDQEHSVAIERGENAGHTLIYYNVVRDIHRIGTWNGAAEKIAVDPASLAGADHAAVLLQADGEGKILAAQKLP